MATKAPKVSKVTSPGGYKATPAKPNPKAPLGQGGRFAAVAKEAGGGKKGAAIAAAAGRKKYGQAKMTQLSVKGRKAAK